MNLRKEILILLTVSIIFSSVNAQVEGQNGNVTKSNGFYTEEKKDGRVFSLFSVVTFKNIGCTTSSDTTMKGTCYTVSECAAKGGTSGGNCAAGFGVCCMFTVSTCAATVSQNCTYVQNPGYPSSYSSTTTSCAYTISPVQSDICQLRLDFNNFVTTLVSPATGACADSFVVTTPSGVTTTGVCGTLTGQHMYVDTGSSTASSTLTFTLGTTTGTKTWKMKVSQIECWNKAKAPADCRQYFTGPSGVIKSYNFGGAQMLTSQLYTNCVRQEAGYCAIDYTTSTASSPSTFNLGTPTIASGLGMNAIATNNPCTLGAILIPSDTTGNGVQYCGAYLSTIAGNVINGGIRDTVSPFILGVVTPAGSQPTAATGFSLTYNQVPCN